MRHNNVDAVSPVVGVMLMLVVTLVLAAVVSAFVGGFGGDMQGAPSTMLEVHVYANKNYGAEPGTSDDGFYTSGMTIESLSGDIISTKDMYIVTYFTNTTGSTCSGRTTGEEYVSGSSGWTGFGESDNCGVLFFSDSNRFPNVITSSTGNSAWFGNRSAVLRPGDLLVTPAKYCGNSDDNDGPSAPHWNEAIQKIFGLTRTQTIEEQGFFAGNSVDIKILHYPSGKCIYDKMVVIE